MVTRFTLEAVGGRREMAWATVYQKHRSVQSHIRRCIQTDACPMPEGQRDGLGGSPSKP
jgi:hypothetical protein